MTCYHVMGARNACCVCRASACLSRGSSSSRIICAHVSSSVQVVPPSVAHLGADGPLCDRLDHDVLDLAQSRPLREPRGCKDLRRWTSRPRAVPPTRRDAGAATRSAHGRLCWASLPSCPTSRHYARPGVVWRLRGTVLTSVNHHWVLPAQMQYWSPAEKLSTFWDRAGP